VIGRRLMAKVKNSVKPVDRKRIVSGFFSKARGLQLAKDFPEIEDDYRNGKKLIEMAMEYDRHDYDISPHVAESAISEAVKILFKGKKVELNRIRAEKRHENAVRRGRNGGNVSYRKGVGCFNMSMKKRSEISRKAGKKVGPVTGKRLYEERIGMFSDDFDLVSSGKNAALARGEVPYDFVKINIPDYSWMTEKEYIMELRRETYTWEDITSLVNDEFGFGRKFETIRTMYNSNWIRETRSDAA
jgi:hypothetical protein